MNRQLHTELDPELLRKLAGGQVLGELQLPKAVVDDVLARYLLTSVVYCTVEGPSYS